MNSHFRRNGCARPHDGIEVLWRGLFSPEELLTAKHQRGVRCGEARERVEGIGLYVSQVRDAREATSPTPTFCQLLYGSHQLFVPAMFPIHSPPPQSFSRKCAECRPSSRETAAYQVEVVRRCVHDTEAFFHNAGRIRRGLPYPSNASEVMFDTCMEQTYVTIVSLARVTW